MAGDGAQGQVQAVEQREAEDDELASSLQGLATLAAGRLPLEEMLTRVARHAVHPRRRRRRAGLIEQHRSDTVVTTVAFVGEVDAVQYSLGQGSCISAARDKVTVIAGSLGQDPRWPRVRRPGCTAGCACALSLPLVTSEGVVRAMNVYAQAKHAFDGRAAELSEVFAVPAAVAVLNARVLADTRRLAERLQHTLDERVVIERAIGIVMSRSGVDDVEALARLTKLNQYEHVSSSRSPAPSSTRLPAAPAPHHLDDPALRAETLTNDWLHQPRRAPAGGSRQG